jgi:uncharacterized protein
MSLRESHILAEAQEEVQRRFSGVDDLAHGWEHVQRVYQLALYIAEKEGADRFIVGMAALLHDLGRAAVEGQRGGSHAHHADLSVELAGELLCGYGVTEEQREAILHAIIAHSFSRGVEPRTLEAMVVRDADRLDGLGAIGVLRWAQTGMVRRSVETRSYHPEDPFAERHEPDDRRYLLDHFYCKLLKLGETMATESGRMLAKRRTDFMRTYLDELKHELEPV